MIIRLRNITAGDFEVEVDEDETVDTLKAFICASRPDLADEPSDVKLIYKGKVLNNGDATITSTGYTEGSFMAMMGKKKAAPAAAPAPAAPAAMPAQGGYNAPAAPAAASPSAAMLQATGGLGGLPPPPEDVVAQLCSMGFDRAMVLRALQAAFNNGDRATEYLLDGNIPPPPADAPAPQAAPAAAPGGGASGGGIEALLGQELLTKSGMQPTSQALGGAKVVLLYFSAHWCPPCQRFTPMLANAFTSMAAGHLQTVFVSSDRDEASFGHYYATMPWLALPFGGEGARLQHKQWLSTTFGVRGIPALVALNGSTGAVLDASARDTLTQNGFNLAQCCSQWGFPAAGAEPMRAFGPSDSSTPAPAAKPTVPEPPVVAIDDAAVRMALDHVSTLDLEQQDSWCGTLLKILNNILQNPQEAKFRSLKKTNAALQSKVFGVAGEAACAVLTIAGFEDGAEMIALPGPPDGRCTAVRKALASFAEAEAMKRLRADRDAKIAEEQEKDKARRPDRSFGGDDKGRNSYGSSRRPRGGGG